MNTTRWADPAFGPIELLPKIRESREESEEDP